MRISIFGSGYVGLVTGACLAEIGHEVLCSDNDISKVQILKAGKLPIYEPGLDSVVEANVAAGRLRFSSDLEEAATSGDVLFVCVGTPPLPNGEADLSAVDNVARLIAKVARTPKLVVEKSTVPIQTGQQVKRALAVYGRAHAKLFSVASNPEFLREGTAVLDFLHPDRIVVGVDDHESEKILRDMYRPIVERSFHCRIHNNNCGVLSYPLAAGAGGSPILDCELRQHQYIDSGHINNAMIEDFGGLAKSMPVFSALGIRQHYVRRVQGGKSEVKVQYPVKLVEVAARVAG